MLKIKADLLFDSTAGCFRKDPVVALEGNRIVSVRFGEADDAGGARIDLPGCTLLPGFVDAHDHLSLSPHRKNHPRLMLEADAALTIRGALNMKTDLLSGVTTSRCLGDKNFVDLELRRFVEAGEIEGPRIVTCTRGIKASHAPGFVGTAVDGCDAIRKTIRENISRGADFTKLFVTGTTDDDGFFPIYLSPEEIEAAVAESHRRGKKVAAHCVGGEGLDICLNLGVDIIEHAYFATDAQIARMEEKDCAVVLTPGIFYHDARWGTIGTQAVAEFAARREKVAERTRKIFASKLKTAAGTDASHGELADAAILMKEVFGVAPARSLQEITVNGARLCGMAQSIGSVAAGKLADIVACRGHADLDIRALKEIMFVMKDGIIYKNDRR